MSSWRDARDAVAILMVVVFFVVKEYGAAATLISAFMIVEAIERGGRI